MGCKQCGSVIFGTGKIHCFKRVFNDERFWSLVMERDSFMGAMLHNILRLGLCVMYSNGLKLSRLCKFG